MSTARETITSQIQTLAGLYGTLEDPAYKELVSAFHNLNPDNKIVIIDDDNFISNLFISNLSDTKFRAFNISFDALDHVKESLFLDRDILIYISAPEMRVLKSAYELSEQRQLNKFSIHAGVRSTELGNELGLIEISTNSKDQSLTQQMFSIISVLEYALADSAVYDSTPVKTSKPKQALKQEVKQVVKPQPASVQKPSLLQDFQAETVIPSAAPDEPNFIVPSGDELAAMIAAANAQIGKPEQKTQTRQNEYLSDDPDDLADRSFT